MEPVPAPIPDFVTPRLSLSRLRRADLDDGGRAGLARELGTVLTPGVLRHLPEPLQLGSDPAGIALWIEKRLAESDILIARTRLEGCIAGLLILAAFKDEGIPVTIHIGYLLAEADWGKGLATEMLKGLIEAARGAGKLRLIGGVSTGNAASARVLERAGFRRAADLSGDGTIMFVRDLT